MSQTRNRRMKKRIETELAEENRDGGRQATKIKKKRRKRQNDYNKKRNINTKGKKKKKRLLHVLPILGSCKSFF